jgi:hypothetical protein
VVEKQDAVRSSEFVWVSKSRVKRPPGGCLRMNEWLFVLYGVATNRPSSDLAKECDGCKIGWRVKRMTEWETDCRNGTDFFLSGLVVGDGTM